MKTAYEHLLSPIRIKDRTLRNRMVKTAAGSRYWSPDGFVTERVKALFDKISSGGASLVSVDTMSFMPWGDAKFTMGGVWDDKFIPGLKELVEIVHANGALIMAQLHQAGPADIQDPVAPSLLTREEMPLNDPIPRELTIGEIEEMKEYYFRAVERLVEAGFDGIEVHAAHGYWLASFLSRVWNKRHDKYGIDTYENRTRLPREIMQGVREHSPADFLMGVRMNGIEFGNERALTTDEAVEIASYFEKEGVDYISVTGEGYGLMPSPMLYLPADYYPYPEPDSFMLPYMKDFNDLGTLIPPAERIKQAVSVPIICVGRLTPETAEQVLSEGKADIAGFNRSLWADPDMPNKLAAGLPETIRRCNRCGTCEGGGKIASMGPRVCRVNPALGRYDLDPHPAKTKKRVLVVGGGPAGMEAACTAAECGHEVSLCEKAEKLGGHLPLASMIKGTHLDNVNLLLDWLTYRVAHLLIEVHTGKKIEVSDVLSMKPDVVIVASGGIYVPEDIEGTTKKTSKDVNNLQKQAEAPMKLFGAAFIDKATHYFLPGVGKNVCVVGTGIAGLQGALWLKKRGRNVTIVSKDSQIAEQMPPRFRNRLLPWFDTHDVDILTEIEDLRMMRREAKVRTHNQELTISCDTVMSLPSMSEGLALAQELAGQGFVVLCAGSVKGEGNDLIVDAIRDGREVGLAVEEAEKTERADRPGMC